MDDDFSYESQQAGIDWLLDGLHTDADLVFDLGEERTRAYILPLESDGQRSVGIFDFDRYVENVKVGFKQTPRFGDTSYIVPHRDHGLAITPIMGDHIYLPLKVTDTLMEIETLVGDEVVDSIVSLYGVKGTEEDLPIVLVSETDEGFAYKVMGKDIDTGNLVSFQIYNGPSEEKMEEFVSRFKSSNFMGEIEGLLSENFQGQTQPAEQVQEEDREDLDWTDPQDLKAYLDRYVVGNESAKKEVAVAMSSYMMRVASGDESLPKLNLTLIGPTGSGKTYMLELLAKEAHVPLARKKLTGTSGAGYHGSSLEDAFKRIHQQTDGDEHAPYGIVFFDEIDKVIRGFQTNDFGPKLQDELIGYIEGTEIMWQEMTQFGIQDITMDTRNLMFVAAGAFTSLEEIVHKRLGRKEKGIGFGADLETEETTIDMLQHVTPQDLMDYGLKPELVGRLPIIGVTEQLDTEQKVEILTKKEDNIVAKFENLFRVRGYEMEIGVGVPELIAEACPPETGARALNSVTNALFTDIYYDPKKFARDGKIVLTADTADKLIKGEHVQGVIESEIEQAWREREEQEEIARTTLESEPDDGLTPRNAEAPGEIAAENGRD